MLCSRHEKCFWPCSLQRTQVLADRQRLRLVKAIFICGKEGGLAVATYKDPCRVFAPLEVLERVLEIREAAGYAPVIFLCVSDDMAAYLDAYGFDVYAFAKSATEFPYGCYHAPLVPGGDHAHSSATAH